MDALWCRISHSCQKLSNSGDTLKLLILSVNRKVNSGWSNYSGIVINQNKMETEKGYHGSKSIILTDNIVVKEQRVDGSCIGAPGLKKKTYQC